jgi:hypothetical protein
MVIYSHAPLAWEASWQLLGAFQRRTVILTFCFTSGKNCLALFNQYLILTGCSTDSHHTTCLSVLWTEDHFGLPVTWHLSPQVCVSNSRTNLHCLTNKFEPLNSIWNLASHHCYEDMGNQNEDAGPRPLSALNVTCTFVQQHNKLFRKISYNCLCLLAIIYTKRNWWLKVKQHLCRRKLYLNLHSSWH